MPHHTDWALILLVIVALQLIYLRLVFPRRFDAFRVSVNNLRPLLSFYKPGRTHFDLFLLMRNLIFLGTAPLSLVIFFRLAANNQIQANDWKLFLAIAVVIVVIMQLQRILLLAAGWIFQSSDTVSEQIFAKSFIWRWVSLLLLPLNFVAIYWSWAGPWMAYLLLFVLLSSYLWSILKSLSNQSAGAILHPGYLFYYICALEILPWLVVLNHWEEMWRWSAVTI